MVYVARVTDTACRLLELPEIEDFLLTVATESNKDGSFIDTHSGGY